MTEKGLFKEKNKKVMRSDDGNIPVLIRVEHTFSSIHQNITTNYWTNEKRKNKL